MMSNTRFAGARSRSKTRLAVTAAALSVIGCFAAAFTFAEGTPTDLPVAAATTTIAAG